MLTCNELRNQRSNVAGGRTCPPAALSGDRQCKDHRSADNNRLRHGTPRCHILISRFRDHQAGFASYYQNIEIWQECSKLHSCPVVFSTEALPRLLHATEACGSIWLIYSQNELSNVLRKNDRSASALLSLSRAETASQCDT